MNLVKNHLSSIAICLLIAVSLPLSPSVMAAGESSYQSGEAAYKQRKYAKAAELFWQSINEGNASAHAWLYMAHAYSAAGNREKAVDSYKRVAQIFKGQPAERIALSGLQKALNRPTSNIDTRVITTSTVGVNSTATSMRPISKPKTLNPDEYRILPLTDRVIVWRANPRFGHPNVTDTSVGAVSSAIRRLPKNIYKLLEDGGVTITIAPNIIDKWPDMVKNDSLDGAAQNLAQESGRCYGRDVHVWQNALANNSLSVNATRSSGFMVRSLYHELGHAVDDCLGRYSSSAEALKLHEQDVKEMPDVLRIKMNYYTQSGEKGCSEACAELFSNLLGANDSDAVICAQYFRRLNHFVRRKVKL